MKPNPWLVRQLANHRPFRLYCFCYAGGNASVFMPWQKYLDPEVEVCAIQLPGRGIRMNEPPLDVLPELVALLADAIEMEDGKPFAFFGHSLGGLIAFELARYCKFSRRPMPKSLIVSGCAAPQFRNPSRNLHRLPHNQLIEELKKYNGTPPEVLQHQELMELLLPIIRADFRLAEEYAYRAMPLLDIPVTVLAGRLDEHVNVRQAEGWERETSAAFQVHWFEGDHFFINSERDAVIARVARVLASQQPVSQ